MNDMNDMNKSKERVLSGENKDKDKGKNVYFRARARSKNIFCISHE